MTEPVISVILPAYNSENYVRQSINSILEQTYLNFELIIINDGSTDSTSKIIKSIKDPRIIYFENKINQGLIYSLNFGINIARGAFIARMDADDVSLYNRLEKQINFLKDNKDIGVVGSAFQPIDLNNKLLMNPIYRPVWPAAAEWFLLIGCPLAHPSVMFRTNLARQIKGYDENFPHTEDYEFWTRMVRITKICSLREPLILYRVNNLNRISEKYYSIQNNLSNQIRIKYCTEHFGEEMTIEISRIIQGENLKSGNNKDKVDACILLNKTYQQIINRQNILIEEFREITSLYNENVIKIIKSINDKEKLYVYPFNKFNRLKIFLRKALVRFLG